MNPIRILAQLALSAACAAPAMAQENYEIQVYPSKTADPKSTLFELHSNFTGTGTAQVYQLTNANAIVRLADVSYLNNTLTNNLPAQSITLFVLPAAPAGLAVTAAYSRKMHGGGVLGPFDLPIERMPAIDGAVTVEPRVMASAHTIVFRMNATVNSTGAVTAVNAAAVSVGSPIVTHANNEVLVTLTGVADNQRVTVTVANINSAGVNAIASLGFLVGDVSNTRAINACDIGGAKAHLSQNANPTNFMFDIDLSGTIDSADISALKVRSGRVLQ